MVGLQVLPEVQGEHAREVFETGVVQGRLAFGEVVDDEIADRPAFELIAVDQLIGGELPGEHSQGPQGGGGVRRELPHVLEEGVEQEPAVTTPLLQGDGLGLPQFDAVTDGDVADSTALGEEDHRDLGASLEPGSGGQHDRVGGFFDPGESRWVAVLNHGLAPVAGLDDPQQERQVGADDICDEKAEQPASQCLLPGALSALGQPGQHHVGPLQAQCVRRGGLPSLLPCRPGEGFEPAEDLAGAVPTVFVHRFDTCSQRRSVDPGQDRLAGLLGCGPCGGPRPRRELREQPPGCLAVRLGGVASRLGWLGSSRWRGGHGSPPNRVFSEAGL